MYIGFWQIIIIAVVIGVLIGSGYLGIYIFNQNSKFKKFKYITRTKVYQRYKRLPERGMDRGKN